MITSLFRITEVPRLTNVQRRTYAYEKAGHRYIGNTHHFTREETNLFPPTPLAHTHTQLNRLQTPLQFCLRENLIA